MPRARPLGRAGRRAPGTRRQRAASVSTPHTHTHAHCRPHTHTPAAAAAALAAAAAMKTPRQALALHQDQRPLARRGRARCVGAGHLGKHGGSGPLAATSHKTTLPSCEHEATTVGRDGSKLSPCTPPWCGWAAATRVGGLGAGAEPGGGSGEARALARASADQPPPAASP